MLGANPNLLYLLKREGRIEAECRSLLNFRTLTGSVSSNLTLRANMGMKWCRRGDKAEVNRSGQGFNSLHLHQTALGLRVHPPYVCGI